MVFYCCWCRLKRWISLHKLMDHALQASLLSIDTLDYHGLPSSSLWFPFITIIETWIGLLLSSSITQVTHSWTRDKVVCFDMYILNCNLLCCRLVAAAGLLQVSLNCWIVDIVHDIDTFKSTWFVPWQKKKWRHDWFRQSSPPVLTVVPKTPLKCTLIHPYVNIPWKVIKWKTSSANRWFVSFPLLDASFRTTPLNVRKMLLRVIIVCTSHIRIMIICLF